MNAIGLTQGLAATLKTIDNLVTDSDVKAKSWKQAITDYLQTPRARRQQLADGKFGLFWQAYT